MSPEPVGSTHLRFGDARVIEILVCGNPKVVRSPGCHEEFWNGPEVKIYIWEVLFWSPEKFRGALGNIAGPLGGSRGSTRWGHRPQRAAWAKCGRGPAPGGLVRPLNRAQGA